MSASPAYDLSPGRQGSIVPHHTTTATNGVRKSTSIARCPRCHQPVALPGWASDGDLTECRGLLLRVTREGDAAWLEQL